MVADRHKHAVYYKSTGNKLFKSINIDDLERPWSPKNSVLVNFLRFRAATHIWRVNCAVTAGDRLRQPTYEIFSLKRRF